jgi:hypothetical protein
MSDLRNIPETCPIYNEAEQEFNYLKDEIEQRLILRRQRNPVGDEYLGKQLIEHAESMLECVDRCRDISGWLRKMCIERGEKIQELEEMLEAAIPYTDEL